MAAFGGGVVPAGCVGAGLPREGKERGARLFFHLEDVLSEGFLFTPVLGALLVLLGAVAFVEEEEGDEDEEHRYVEGSFSIVWSWFRAAVYSHPTIPIATSA